MKRSVVIGILLVSAVLFVSSCAHRDCRGNKHRVKTDMGGYL